MSSWRNKLPSRHDRSAGARARNSSERIVCVLNPRAQAGRAGDRVDVLRRALDRSFAQADVVVSQGPGHATELAREAIRQGADIVAAVGGDGTCNEVANGFFEGERPVRRSAVFAVIPWGTGSDLARSVRAPGGLDDALWVASTGMTLPTDVGVVEFVDHDGQPDQRIFVNVAGFGANGDVVNRANQASKRLGGRLTFLQATLGTLTLYEAPDVHIRWRGPAGEGAWDKRMLSCFVANGARVGGGMNVGAGGSMHDGAFDLTVLPFKGRVRNIAESWRLYDGSVWRSGGARRVYATWLHAEPKGTAPVLLDIDGEQPGRLPAIFRILPGALQVRGGWLRSPLLRDEREVWRPR
ncbi:MAG: diacylglycerol kinase family lipid kinase [Alphaproteobacteria bacterium]|nr:diacylglycerol kinase family lipid kinase [Alphaproteobacteria bacterium]